jgi:tRNA(Ile)-lysidine synthase
VHPLAKRLLDEIQGKELVHAGDRLGAAVSGGIDSIALLRLLLEVRADLGFVLSVVHFHHRLRGPESDADQEFVATLAREHGLEFFTDSDDVARHAAQERLSLEAAARELRYGFFRTLFEPGHGSLHSDPKAAADNSRPLLAKIATAHTLDDQAETVLMRVIRGSGPAGLAGIHTRLEVENDGGEICGEIVRPLLPFRRSELEQYLKAIGQSWREDSTNSDLFFTRNRVRHLLMPVLEKEFNPAVAENLAELAEIASGEQDYWENEIAGWMGTTVHWSEPAWAHPSLNPAGLVQIEGNPAHGSPGATTGAGEAIPPPGDELQAKIDHAPWLVANASVGRGWFLGEPLAVQRRLVKAIGERAGIPLEFKHVEEILRFAESERTSGKELSLPHGWKLRSTREELSFVTPDLRKADDEPDPQSDEYDCPLAIPGSVPLARIGVRIEAHCLRPHERPAYEPDQLLDAGALRKPFRVRNWRAGDRFWPAHTKSPKKVKELLYERRMAPSERNLWPVVVSGDEIVWMRGFPTPAKLQPAADGEAILILEKRLGEDSVG